MEKRNERMVGITEQEQNKGKRMKRRRSISETSGAIFSSVQSISHVQLCNPMNHSMPGLPVHHQLPEFTQTHVHRVGDALQTSHPVIPFSSYPQSFPASGSFPSQLFTSGGQSIKSFSFNINPSNECPGLISFTMEWLDLLAVQGTLKSLL